MGATGIGALLGAVSLAARVGIKGLGRLIAFCAAGFGVALIAFSFSRVFWLSALLLIPVGFFMMVQMASSNTLVQSMVPDSMRGRVMSLYSMMFMGMAPFGGFFAGAIAHRIGAPYTVAIGGVACIAGGCAYGRYLPKIRGQAREIMAQGMTAGVPAQEVTGQGD
jgi:MFS family permease